MVHRLSFTRGASFALVLILVAPLGGAFPPESVPETCYEEGSFPGADVLFVLDLTGSMGGVLSSAKAEATAIMDDLRAAVSDIRFGAASHMDYPGTYSYPGYSAQYGGASDYPWRLDADMTTDIPTVQAAITGLTLGWGADGPESYTTAMYEAGESVSWGAARLKVIVFFGDNVPHDLNWNGRNTGGEPGRDGIAMTADDLDWETTVAGLAAKGIRVVGIDSGGGHEMMSYLAAQTGGDWTTLGSGSQFRQTIVDMVLGIVDAPTPIDAAPPTIAFTSPLSPRLIVDGVDVGPSPFPETTLVGSDLPLDLVADDDCKLMLVELRDNGGAPFATFSDFPLSHTYQAASLPPGFHTLQARATDWVGKTANATLGVRILALDEHSEALGLYAAVNVPVALEVVAGRAAAAGSAGASQSTYGARTLPVSLTEVSYETMRAVATSELGADAVSRAMATSVVSQVSLLDGRIVVENLRAVSMVSQTVSGARTFDTTGSYVTGLVVDGVPVEWDGGRMDIAIPGVGFLRLFEVETPTSVGAVMQVNMLHLFLESPQLKGEIILGSAFAAAGFLSGSESHHRVIHDDDDAGTDADAHAQAAQATPIAPGLHSGRVSGTDPRDAYRFEAGEGDRIVLALLPATRVGVELVREPTASPLDAGATVTPSAATLTHVDLYDPQGFWRDRTALGSGDRIEFNADKQGQWVAIVDGSAEVQPRNYTLAFSLSPIVFFPGDDLDGDAPATCAQARPIEHGVHFGVMRGADFQDAYAIDANIGEIITVVLKSDELDDGANFDLLLFDPDCALLQISTLGGPNNGLLPKGSPDVVAQLPAERTGAYRFVIVRVDGVGNYYFDARSTNPMPTIPQNDAGTGRDSTGSHDAIPLASPAVVQGSFPDEHDTADWYRVSAPAGETLRVTVTASALSQLSVTIRTPTLASVQTQVIYLAPGVFTLPAGDYFVEIVRSGGGGNYLVSATSTAR